MENKKERDYVLGTHDAELKRLGLQHSVWREAMLAGWKRAGIGPDARVVDVGAGPGYATLDLAEVVGPKGHVLAIERSGRYAAALRERLRQRSLTHVEVVEADLMAAPQVTGYDAAWCRWVATFVPSPPTLVEWLHRAIRPGGKVIFHEYGHWESFSFGPRRPRLLEFVVEVVRAWRASGGEPNIGLDLPELLDAAGFQMLEVRPLVSVVHPGDEVWRWPASFVRVHLDFQVEQKTVTAEWADAVRAELDALEGDPRSMMLTPLVLELIASRR